MKKIKSIAFGVTEILFFPLTIISAGWSKIIAKAGIRKTILAEKIYMFFGVMPVADHYYQPLINPKKHLKISLRSDRTLPGIDLNIEGQLKTLEKFNYNKELLEFPMEDSAEKKFYYNNNSFAPGDSEYLYNVIRSFKPKKIIEIGSGNSTLIAIEAVNKNKSDDPQAVVQHICIEPYEQPWLEKTPAKIIRQKVEDIDKEIFESLQENDILFIDSSHIIRPQGDVLFEYLEILPILKPGVLVHIHDIFTPKDYLDSWIYQEHYLWNEQYLFEAFISMNKEYEIIGALNYLSHNFREKLADKCPIFASQKNSEPGSMWLRKK
jgi:hypothetical protein